MSRFRSYSLLAAAILIAAPVLADDDDDDDDRRRHGNTCQGLPSANQLRNFLNAAAPAPEANAATGPIGGLFNGKRMWAATVNRDGEVCEAVTSTNDPTQVWPGSQAIAKSKAYTANAFSLDSLALSTARLYTFTQPGHSLWSLGQSNLYDPKTLSAPGKSDEGQGKIQGGLIFFGGGVPLYRNGKIIGGLGVSGDTSCADHEIAKGVRALAGLNPPGGQNVDDITYNLPPGEPASAFTHPKCLNTWRNGLFIGTELPATGY